MQHGQPQAASRAAISHYQALLERAGDEHTALKQGQDDDTAK
jgi:hypothetical protein